MGSSERLRDDMGESDQVLGPQNPQLSSEPLLSSPELTFMSANHVPGTLVVHLHKYPPANELHTHVIRTVSWPQFIDE